MAFVIAVVVDLWIPVRRSVYPLRAISQTIPIVAIAPLIVVWFGFGMAPKVALVALFTFFSITVGFVQGLASSDRDAVNLLRTMEANRFQILWRVRLPSALPSFFTGLRISVTYAFVAAILAESSALSTASACT